MPLGRKMIFYGAPVLVLLLAIAEFGTSAFFDYLRTGALIGLGIVVLVLYPALLHQHERRLSALENRSEPKEQSD